MTPDPAPAVVAPPDMVNALAASPQFERDGVCFAAQNSGLYRSDDGGRSWRPAYDFLGLDVSLGTTAVAISPAFERDRTVFAGVNGAVLRSTDAGTTWRAIMLPEPPPLVTALVVSPNFEQDGIVFAGTMEDGMFRSADRGSTWAAWNFGLLDLDVLCLAISPSFVADETIFVGTGSGLFRSTNGGRAWREVALPFEFAPVLSAALVQQSAGAGALYVGTEGEGLFVSTAEGRTWQRLGEDVLLGTINCIVLAPQSSSTSTILLLLNDTLVVSHDAGASWSIWPLGGERQAGIAAIAAPMGLGTAATLIAGLVEGGVVRL